MNRIPVCALQALAFLSVLCISANADPPQKSDTDLTAYNGKYYLSLSCSDECAELTVHFRRTTAAEGAARGIDEWRADGKVKDSIERNLVKFTGALVHIAEDGSVRVWASCVRFSIDKAGKLLAFDGYDRSYER